jgi:phage terminase large subunit-like protein
MIIRALKAPGTRHVIFRFRFNHVRQSIFAETLPQVLKLCFPELPVELNAVECSTTFTNGSTILLGGLDQKDRTEKILGQEFSTIYFNEASGISYNAVLIAQTRLAQKSALVPKFYFDANPPTTGHWLYRYFMLKIDPTTNVPHDDPDAYVSMRLNPEGNKANLAEGYLETLAALPDRQRRRFLHGEWLSDNPHALWRASDIAVTRVLGAPPLRRVVVGVDPAVSAHEGSDETGIVVAGADANGQYYVLEDASLQGSPLVWAQEVVRVYRQYKADRVVAEVNQGGDLVISNLRGVDRHIAVSPIRSMRGKVLRAEPIAALYEQKCVHHVGEHAALETQMIDWDPTDASASSPDRVDALVFALTELAGRPYCRPAILGVRLPTLVGGRR